MPGTWYEVEVYIDEVGTFTLFAAPCRKDAAAYARRWIRAYQTFRRNEAAGAAVASARRNRAHARLATLTPIHLFDYVSEDDQFAQTCDDVFIQQVTARADRPLDKTRVEVMGIPRDPDGGKGGGRP